MSQSNSGCTVTFGFGSILGMILSWLKFHSIFSLIWPLIFGWLYVLYFVFRHL